MTGNSNSEVIRKIRDVIEKGGNIDVNTRDVLLFTAIIDIYEQNELSRAEMKQLREETKPAVLFTKVGVWVLSVAGVGFISFIGALLTGQVEIVVK